MRFISKTALLTVRLASEKVVHNNETGRLEQLEGAKTVSFKNRAYVTKNKETIALMLKHIQKCEDQGMQKMFSVHPEDQAEADKFFDVLEEPQTYTPPAVTPGKKVAKKKVVEAEEKTQGSDDAQT